MLAIVVAANAVGGGVALMDLIRHRMTSAVPEEKPLATATVES
jgi:hypothetical protein